MQVMELQDIFHRVVTHLRQQNRKASETRLGHRHGLFGPRDSIVVIAPLMGCGGLSD